MSLKNSDELRHYGVKGMKWGYTDGQSNGNRKAGDAPNSGGSGEDEEDEEDEEGEETETKWANGLDKDKYYRRRLPDGSYVYGLKKDKKKNKSDDKEPKEKGITYGTKENERKRVKRKSELDKVEEPRKRVKRKSDSKKEVVKELADKLEKDRKKQEQKAKQEREERERKERELREKRERERKEKEERERKARLANRPSDYLPFR